MSVWFARVRCHLLNDRGWPWNWRAVQWWAKRRARPCGIDVRGDRCSCGHADFFHRCEECGCEAFVAASLPADERLRVFTPEDFGPGEVAASGSADDEAGA